MSRWIRYALFAIPFCVVAARADPPQIVASPGPKAAMPTAGMPVILDPGKFVWLDLEGHAGPVTWAFTADGIVDLPEGSGESWGGHKQGEAKAGWHKAPSKTAVPCLGVSPGTVTITAWGVVDGKAKRLAALTIAVGPAPPDVKPDEPKPDVKPDPKPVTSFRVFLIYESGATYPSAVNTVLYGNVVESWLNENCTGGKAGWRRRDKDLSGDADPTMAALWKAVQPSLTTIPCVAVEVNGKAEIIPLEVTPAAMVAKLNTYRGNK